MLLRVARPALPPALALTIILGTAASVPVSVASVFDQNPVAPPSPKKLPAIPQSCPYVVHWDVAHGPVFNSRAAKKAISFSANSPHNRVITLQPRPRKGYVGCVLMGKAVLKGTTTCNPGGKQSWPLFVLTNVVHGAFCTSRTEDNQYESQFHTDKVIFAARRRR